MESESVDIDAYLLERFLGRDARRFDVTVTKHFFRLRPRLAIRALLRRPRGRRILGVKIQTMKIIIYDVEWAT